MAIAQQTIANASILAVVEFIGIIFSSFSCNSKFTTCSNSCNSNSSHSSNRSSNNSSHSSNNSNRSSNNSNRSLCRHSRHCLNESLDEEDARYGGGYCVWLDRSDGSDDYRQKPTSKSGSKSFHYSFSILISLYSSPQNTCTYLYE